MENRLTATPGVYFGACCLPLLAANLVQVAIICRYGTEKAMWPVILVFMAIWSLLYAALAYLPAHLARHYDLRLACRHHALLGIALVIHMWLYHLLKPDWIAVRSGVAALTFVQALVSHRAMPMAIYPVFYVMLAARYVTLRR